MDLERLRGLYTRVNVCPLGSGALAGNPFHVDRETLGQDLGFQAVTKNSLNAVGDRDFIGVCVFYLVVFFYLPQLYSYGPISMSIFIQSFLQLIYILCHYHLFY